jgi:hypothetical protein
MESKKQDDVLEAASRCVKLLRHAELQACDATWSEAAAALVNHVHTTVGGCVSRKWQVAAEAALVIPALVDILTHRAAAPSLKLDAVEALRLTICSNEMNQKLASSAAATLVALATILPPAPPPSEGPKAALLARNIAEQLRDAALQALSDLVFMHRPSQDAAVAAEVIKHLIIFISCTGPQNMNAAATQERALRVLTNLTRGNVICLTLLHLRSHLCSFVVLFRMVHGPYNPCQVDATKAAADSCAVAALVAAGRARLASQETKLLVVAALISLISLPEVADAACGQGVLPLMIDLLRAQPHSSLAVASLQCACMLMYGRGDMCRLAAEAGLPHTLHTLRGKEYGDDFDALSSNAEAVMLDYK